MTDLQARIRAAVVAEPGERPEYYADLLGLELGVVVAQARALSVVGHFAPRAYRLWPHVLRRLQQIPAEQVIGPIVDRSDGLDRAAWLVSQLRAGPLSAAELASRGEADEDGCRPTQLPGGWKRILATLERYGVVSSPAGLWPTEAGIAAVRGGEE